MKSLNSEAVLGALVADSAALGLHWIYDSARIAEIEAARGSRGLVFLQPEEANYAGAKGYFAHSGKTSGESSSYGEICLLMLKHLAKHGRFNRVEYQSEYRACFGPGGKYVVYIDSPTRLTLRILLPLEPADFPAASGAEIRGPVDPELLRSLRCGQDHKSSVVPGRRCPLPARQESPHYSDSSFFTFFQAA